MRSKEKVEFGDFQTPLGLAADVCALLVELGEAPAIVLEPTAGRGAFLLAAADAFPDAALHGWDINPGHLSAAARAFHARDHERKIHLTEQDFFTADIVAVMDVNGLVSWGYSG